MQTIKHILYRIKKVLGLNPKKPIIGKACEMPDEYTQEEKQIRDAFKKLAKKQSCTMKHKKRG